MARLPGQRLSAYAVSGIVAGGCYQERDWYPYQQPPGVDSDVAEFYRWLADLSEDEYWAMRSGKLCRTDGERRATNLLRRHLTEEQWESLGKRRYFLVTGTTRTALGRKREHLFQITSYGVFELKDGGRRNFCIVALEPGLPGADWMLMVLLLIKSDTRKFFATAKTRGWQTMGCNQMA